ncbi:MAG TPA: glycosyltransferase [Vicinamibacterales bacterium]|nr:glycosyltransferase [Vicinamibacterales bacterium]
MDKVKVTVYITNHNYGRFIRQAILSVLHQKFTDWELIIIDDGSTDGSPEIIKEFEHTPNVRVVLQENHGLIVSANIALRLSHGEYIMRLDADDYLDENAVVVLANILDTHPEVGLVYPDYFLIDEKGEILSLERRNKLGTDITLYNVAAHGAGTMVRSRCLQELEGYSDDIGCQDGYDLWIRLIEKFGVYNVNVPLFYYRQHGNSLTVDKARLLKARREIDRRHAQTARNDVTLRTLAIVPARSKAHDEAAYALRAIAGRPLLDYTIDVALACERFAGVVVVSEDEAVLDYVRSRRGVFAVRRPTDLGRPNTSIASTVRFALQHDQLPDGIDAFMLLYVNSPLRTAEHILNAMDNMLIFETDSVISVYEDLLNHYQHVGHGLRPLTNRRALRLEREALWVENGAIYLAKTENLDGPEFLGERIGHTVMLKQESLQIDDEDDFMMVERLITHRRQESTVAHGS